MTASARWPIAAWFCFILVCVVVVSRTQISTDLSAFLPRSPTASQQILVEQLRNGVVSRLILIGIEGDAPPSLAQTSKRLAAQLRAQKTFSSVNNGEDISAQADREFMWRNRYLLSPAVAPGHFSVTSLRAALEEDLQMLGSPAAILLQKVLPSDPTGELLRLIDQFVGQAKPRVEDGVWFSPDGKRAVLVAQTQAAGYDIDAQEEALARIRHAFMQASGTATAQKLLVSGPGVFSVHSRASIKDDAWRFSLIATSLVATLLLTLYRSPRVLALGLLPVASGALAGVAAVSIVFGSVHGITLGFGATLIGEGVDYAIYLFTQIAPNVTPRNTLARIWPTLRLGVLTSICGFSAMLLASFPGLAQLGLFSIVGLIVAVAVTRYVLPALLPIDFTVRAANTLAPAVNAAAQRAAVLRYPLIGLVVLAAAFIAIRESALRNDSLASLSPVSMRDQALDADLRRAIGAPDVRHLVVVTAKDEQAALEASEKIGALLQRLSERKLLAGFESPAAAIPSVAMQRTRQTALPDEAVLREDLAQAQRGLPFRGGLFEPFIRDVAAAKMQSPLERNNLQGTGLALKVDSLLVERATGWAAMLPLRGVSDAPAIARELAELPHGEVVLLDLKRESDELYQTYRREIINYSLLGAFAIVVLLFMSLRAWRRVLGVLTPLLGAVIITWAIFTAAGSALSIFHLVGLLLVVAVGSNYALFFDRRTASVQERERTIISLLFANLSTVIGFGLLAFSQAPVLHGIGATVAIGAILSLIFSAILISGSHPEQVAV